MSHSSSARPSATPPLWSFNNAQQSFAPRPFRGMGTVPPPPKMDKDLFDRCGNCTRAFGFLSRKVFNLPWFLDLTRQRHCANCGFVYCSDCCLEKVKLIKFQGCDSRDVRVCDYCKEFLKSKPPPLSLVRAIRLF